jgi:hyperpolarization activated cyclic nucleotide-gated potassium channel 1
MGCFWYYSAKLYDFSSNTWVYQNDVVNESNWMLYLISIYWAISTISTVGFGDIHAYNEGLPSY